MEIHKEHEYLVEAARVEAKASNEIADFVTKPLVMASAAGWYVGAVCWSREADYPDDLLLQPWDRYTDYMTEKAALEYYEYQKEHDAKEIEQAFNGENYNGVVPH